MRVWRTMNKHTRCFTHCCLGSTWKQVYLMKGVYSASILINTTTTYNTTSHLHSFPHASLHQRHAAQCCMMCPHHHCSHCVMVLDSCHDHHHHHTTVTLPLQFHNALRLATCTNMSTTSTSHVMLLYYCYNANPHQHHLTRSQYSTMVHCVKPHTHSTTTRHSTWCCAPAHPVSCRWRRLPSRR